MTRDGESAGAGAKTFCRKPSAWTVQNQPMDEIVKQALAKWPHVPHCYGWLGLDARGRWYLRDEASQARGDFPQSRGSLLQHDKLIDFIGRNYEADAQGQWFFQNGPQRVYVELECAPWVWRIQPDGTLRSHTGRVATPSGCLMDEQGCIYFDTDLGLGLVHSLDVGLVAEWVERGECSPYSVVAHELADRHGFIRSPAALQYQGPT